jgi:predicted CoA-binding protein
VVGVSDRRDTGCNAAYKRFKDGGYQVYAINPRIGQFQGDPCYPDLKSLPEKPDAVFILSKRTVTDQIVQECVDLGVKHVWMHCMMGTKPGAGASMTSVSPEAVQMCREHGITVIPGTCPNQFLRLILPC